MGSSPWQNGTGESFNGRVGDECQRVEWFHWRGEARVVLEASLRHDNAVRLHSGLTYLTPHEFKQQHRSLPDRAVFQERVAPKTRGASLPHRGN